MRENKNNKVGGLRLKIDFWVQFIDIVCDHPVVK